MISRAISLAIVAFWLIMTWLLVQTVYFPSESRFAGADPEFVIQNFLENSTPSELFVYKGNEKVGEIDLSSRRIKTNGTPGYALSFRADGEVELPNLPKQNLKWDGEFRLDDKWSLHEFSLVVRFSQPENVKIVLSILPKTAEFTYKVFRDGVEMPIEPANQGPGKAQMQMLMMAWGIDPTALDSAEAAAREQERLSSMSARHGNIEIAGRRFHAFILTIKILSGGELKLYFTDDWQIVKVTTFLGYEALSEVVDPKQAGESLEE